MINQKQIVLQMQTLVVFRKLLQDPVVKSMLQLMENMQRSRRESYSLYAEFVSRLFEVNENFTEYLWEAVLKDENIYVKRRAKKAPVSAALRECVAKELETLQAFSQSSADTFKKEIQPEVFLPAWGCTQLDFASAYEAAMTALPVNGFGIFAKSRMFSYREDTIVPVKAADTISLADLTGYAEERQEVVENTLAFLENKPAANVLLYGDAGTGKSSTVKAIVNAYYSRGLRMVELNKGDLLVIPTLLELLAGNPLKFILFIDDLSFTENNHEIGALKAILEGSVYARTPNVVIYATSNRRHLIRETFSERGEDDIHVNETIQEQVSLSDRFGLSVCFSKPDKAAYLEIVHQLAKTYRLKNLDHLDLLAERHALQRGGRSGRTARQFIEALKSME